MSKEFNLSPSKLNLITESPALFWLEAHKKVTLPRGIMSSLPGAIDGYLKAHFDVYRPQGLPPELFGKMYGNLYPDQNRINKWRNWRSQDLQVQKTFAGDVTITLRGAVDDAFVENDHMLSPLDYKTSGKEVDNSYGEKYYQNQLDAYALMLSQVGLTSGKGYLVYYYLTGHTPDEMNCLPFTFTSKVLNLTADPSRCLQLMECAAEILAGECPETDEHELFKFANQYWEAMDSVNKLPTPAA